MTATDELRLPNDTKELDTLLNERGQEHRVWPSGLVVWHDERTVYEYEPAKNHHSEYWGGILRMTMRHCTPEQAIAATLGSDLEAENAKLRELVRVMAYCMQCKRECDECAMNGADGTITALAGCDELRDRMRELGVEVE